MQLFALKDMAIFYVDLFHKIIGIFPNKNVFHGWFPYLSVDSIPVIFMLM